MKGAPGISAFLDLPSIRLHAWRAGRPVWMTLAPMRYQSVMLGTTIVIPAEFITDLASVPRLPLTWFIAGGRAPRPAIVHDYAYQRGEWPLAAGGTRPVSRRCADAVFHEAMLADPLSGTSRVTRTLMWLAVRAGGWSAWRGRQRRAGTLNPEWTEQGWPGEVQAG